MGCSNIAGSCLTAREASAAMALVTAATERECHIMAFADRFMPLNISPRMRPDGVIKAVSSLPFMGTDCALPMIHAREQELTVPAFITCTDSETWAGNVHPAQALRQSIGTILNAVEIMTFLLTPLGLDVRGMSRDLPLFYRH
jgi:60 kDa SS-A/Ro ribonucleoprotein